jgi:acetylornithine deacetylase/succinyl-diaminopimelate desuccinylase-like protein
MHMQAVYDYITAHQEEALAELKTYCAQPSVSAEGQSMAEMVALVQAGLERRNFRVEVVEMPGGQPIIYAESQDKTSRNAPTLLIYNHYDVQPAGELDLWTSPPWELTIRDAKAFARGSADTKGNIVSRLAAIDALRAAHGRLPIKVKWIIEGEEEIGSPSLDAFLLDYHERLTADGCLWEFGTFTWEGAPVITLGMKGMLTVELSVPGPNRDLHSSMAAFVTNPAWRLVNALNALKDEDEDILIRGFRKRINPPSEIDMDLLRNLPDDDETLLQNLGIPEFTLGLSGFQRHYAECFLPTCNIHGLHSGYNGPGTKTILPHEAHAMIDFRLVPDQDPDEILILLRQHLDAEGFTDVGVTKLEESLFPARVSSSHPFVVMAMTTAAELTNRPPLVYPSSPASGPLYSFSNGLGLAVVARGCCYPGSAVHAPDEHIRLRDFLEGTREIALLMYRMAEVDFAAALRLEADLKERQLRRVVAEGDPAAELRDLPDLETGLAPADFDAIAAEMAGMGSPAPPAAAAKPAKRKPRKK